MATSSAPGEVIRRAARAQHGVVARRQLLAAGVTDAMIRNAYGTRRLFEVHRGVYSVGTPELTRHGRWMAAVLAHPAGSVLSHQSGGALLEVVRVDPVVIHVSLPGRSSSRHPGIRGHRPRHLPKADRGSCDGIPVTSPARTLVDLAAVLSTARLEAAVNEAAIRELVDIEDLRRDLDRRPPQPGVRPLRALLDRHAFLLTDSELERRFLSICRRHRLPLPETQVHLDGKRVDFLFRDQGVVVETDGGRFHRTALQQTRDREREHAHLAVGLIPVRFTHHQIWRTPGAVAETLKGAFGLGRGVQSG